MFSFWSYVEGFVDWPPAEAVPAELPYLLAGGLPDAGVAAELPYFFLGVSD